MSEITGLRLRGRGPGRVEIEIDGRLWRTVPSSAAQGLRVGLVLEAGALAEIERRAAEAEALESAGRLLSRRPHSEQEVRRRLERKGFAAPVVEQTLDRLRQSGALDDAAFARAWVENRMTFRPRGPAMLSAELRARGVSGEQARAAIAEVDQEGAARQAAERAARRWGSLAAEPRRRRIYAYLMRRGFSVDTIRSVVGRRTADADASEE